MTEIATLERQKWDVATRARDAASRRGKSEQYEALRRDLESVLSWLSQATYEDVQSASAEVLSTAPSSTSVRRLRGRLG